MIRSKIFALALALFGIIPASPAAHKIRFNEPDLKDRIYACWLGKNIGGTLGMPFEGKKEPNDVIFYTNLKPGEPAANDDLDLQILWLKALEDNNGEVDARILGEYWLRYVPVDWNEYGVAKANLRLGLLPPLSGGYNNRQWKDSNGAWIRSEIWACLAPGYPALAARLAREDACVDHGAAEGTLAEIFTASMESAAFVESDRASLIDFGLSMIPKDCRVARAVRVALQARSAGKDWQEARLAVIQATEDTGWFQAPRNIAFMIIGWLYGDGDFGKSVCTAINCGDDTDCTGATLGSILGIIGGTKSIPARWREPIGDKIMTVAVAGFPIPRDIGQLTESTLAMAKKVLAINKAPVAITAESSNLREAKSILDSGPARARFLWRLSPYQIIWREVDLEVKLDYAADPEIKAAAPRTVHIELRNLDAREKVISLTLEGLPKAWETKGLFTSPLKLKKNATGLIRLTFIASEPAAGPNAMRLKISGGLEPIVLPLTLIGLKTSSR